MKFTFAIDYLKVNKLCRIFFAIQPSQKKFAEYASVIGFYKVETNVKFIIFVVVAIHSNVSLK